MQRNKLIKSNNNTKYCIRSNVIKDKNKRYCIRHYTDQIEIKARKHKAGMDDR